MKDNKGRFEFEENDFESVSNCFHCQDDFPVIHFDKVKDDYVRIRGIGCKPNSCDYVIIARNVRSRKIEIWLIEEKDIILKLVQNLKDLKERGYNIDFEMFVNTIGKIFARVVYDFVYSATVLSDILNSCGIALSDLNDKKKYRFVCMILYRRERLDKVDQKLRQVVELFISSLELSDQAIFITPDELCSELKNYSDVKLVSC